MMITRNVSSNYTQPSPTTEDSPSTSSNRPIQIPHASRQLSEWFNVATRTTDSITQITRQIRDLEQNGEDFNGQLDGLREKRAEQIRDFTGNPSADSYDVDVIGWAQERGTTYNYEAAQLNKSRMFQNLTRPENAQIPYVNIVRELPWESQTVNNEVDRLIGSEGLSADAAIVIAMTERPDQTRYQSLFSLLSAPVEGGWEDSFASRVTKSATQIESWVTNQPESAIASFSDNGVNVEVTMRGDLVIVTDGTTEHVFDPADHDRIVIVGGNGADTITVADSVYANLAIVGGAGDDTIFGGNGDNIIIGGSGNDNIEGGSSGDLILGGQGRDSVYGGGGTDIIGGGSGGDSLYGGDGGDFVIGEDGDDYIDGGYGNDRLRGGSGSDTISGGAGGDILGGEGGSDTLIGSSGSDNYSDATLGDTVIAEHYESVALNGATVRRVDVDRNAGRDSVAIDPDARENFVARVEDDLHTLRSLNTGRAMLTALDTEFARAGHTTVIEELKEENGRARATGGSDIWLQADGTRANGESSITGYNPHYNTATNAAPKVPIAVLFHEFAHAYDFASGQWISGNDNDGTALTNPNFGTHLYELQAAGIAVDHDDDPSTPNQLPNEEGHPLELTENGIREELGLPTRRVY